MGYSNFKKIKQVTKKFGLDAENIKLFSDIKMVEPSTWLKQSLEKAKLFPLTNEKVKSEKIVSPILSEVAEFFSETVTLFSGEDLPVDIDRDLSGECDFLLTFIPQSAYLESIIIVISAQKFMSESIAQCTAQLYGAKLFNEMEGKNFPVLYGCATNGNHWQFLRFENNVFYIDNQIYTDLKEILGVWHHIIQFYLK